MAQNSEMWIWRTATTYTMLQKHVEAPTERGRRRLTTFLDIVLTERVREVGVDQAFDELNKVFHKVGENLVRKY